MSKQKADLEKAFPAVMVMEELPKPRDLFVLKRGQYDKPGEKVIGGVPALAAGLRCRRRKRRIGSIWRSWLVSPEHPLTARVAVNRWWQCTSAPGW